MDTAPTANVDNPYGLQALWAGGDIVARSVLVVLVIMSLASWFVMLTKLWDQNRLKKSAKVVGRIEVQRGGEFQNVVAGTGEAGREAVLDRAFGQGRHRPPEEGR